MSRYQFPQQPIANDTLLGNSSGSTALPSAQSVTAVRTMLGIDASLTSEFGGVASSTYTAGRLTARSYGDGSTKTYAYNGLGQLTVTVHTLADSTVVTLTRTYNADGTLSTIVSS